jgi:tetratricopeptide (TPR) repeat protein
MFQGRLDEAREVLARAVAASDAFDDPMRNAFANGFLTYAQLVCGETQCAYSLAGETLKRAVDTGAGMVLGWANQTLGRTEMALGDLAAARGHLEAAVGVDRRGIAYFLTWHLAALGTLDRMEGNFDAARSRGEEALEVARLIGSGWMQAGAERLLGRLALAAGQPTKAERYVHDALGRLVAKGFAIDIPECLDILAAIAVTEERFDKAARLLGAAAAARERLGIIRFPPEPEFWTDVEQTTHAVLGDDAYNAAFVAGAALDTDEAIGYTGGTVGGRKRPSHGWDS